MGCKDRHNILIDNSLIAKKNISLDKPPENGIKQHLSLRIRGTNHALKTSMPASRKFRFPRFIILLPGF